MQPDNQPAGPVQPIINDQPSSGQPPVMPKMDTGMNGNGHKKVGPIIATLVIVLVLIIAALYIFAARLNQQAIPTDMTSADTSGDSSGATSQAATAPSSVQPVTGTSTDVNSLQNDLDNSTAGLDNQNF